MNATFTSEISRSNRYEINRGFCRSLRILFVDDEPGLVEIAEMLLTHLGHDPVGCSDPVEALVCVRREEFDLVITDLTMPGMTGLELRRALRACRPELPVVLSTAYGLLLEGASAESLGFQGYLPKPYGLKELAKVVQDLAVEQGLAEAL
jgi:CheY-like chemotaxis protein